MIYNLEHVEIHLFVLLYRISATQARRLIVEQRPPGDAAAASTRSIVSQFVWRANTGLLSFQLEQSCMQYL
jgi:hypothetical protein